MHPSGRQHLQYNSQQYNPHQYQQQQQQQQQVFPQAHVGPPFCPPPPHHLQQTVPPFLQHQPRQWPGHQGPQQPFLQQPLLQPPQQPQGQHHPQGSLQPPLQPPVQPLLQPPQQQGQQHPQGSFLPRQPPFIQSQQNHFVQQNPAFQQQQVIPFNQQASSGNYPGQLTPLPPPSGFNHQQAQGLPGHPVPAQLPQQALPPQFGQPQSHQGPTDRYTGPPPPAAAGLVNLAPAAPAAEGFVMGGRGQQAAGGSGRGGRSPGRGRGRFPRNNAHPRENGNSTYVHSGNTNPHQVNNNGVLQVVSPPGRGRGRVAMGRGGRGRGAPPPDTSVAQNVNRSQEPAGGDTGGSSLLQDNLLDLMQHMQLTQEENTHRQTALRRVREATTRAFPQATVEMFGSQAAGSAIHSSDLDMVVLNLAQPPPSAGGYPKEQRPRVAAMLQKILKELRRQGSVLGRVDLIRTARIPIIKCKTPEGVDCDIAIADDSACTAAEWQRKMFEKWPALKPLVICVKTLLRHQGLADVSIGGLSSFSVINMVLAVLQTHAGTTDLGTLFVAFLKLYGKDFDYFAEAVAVSRGGIVTKASVLQNGVNDDNLARQRNDLRLTVEDPLTRRDISGGSYLMWQVKGAFQGAFQTLESIKSRGMSSWNEQSLLGRLMNLRSVITRYGYQYNPALSYSGGGQEQQQAIGSKRPAPHQGDGGEAEGGFADNSPPKASRHMAPGSDAIIGSSSGGPGAGGMAASGSDLFQQRLIAHAQRIANEN